jgi:putative toxin-antitoxin system antitoxin component (TIGR02293 family)
MNEIELMELCTRVMGSTELAEQWMNRPAMGLNYQRPVDLLDTETGRDRVETLLIQIEGGVYI